MQRVQKQGSESENAQRTAQAKFTSWSRENERANAIDDSPAMVAQRKKLQSLFGGAIQRVEDEEPLQGKFETAQRVEEEEPLQGKFETAQRVEEEEPLQGKFEAVQRVEEEEPLQGKFEAAPSVQLKDEPAAKPNNTGLPENLKSGIENLSGMSMDNVKVHYNSSQPAQLNALAYAQGTDIHVAPGQEQHLPHEAWHVVQQAQGRVKPTMQMKEGVPVNDDQSLEHEADVMGARAVSGAEPATVTTGSEKPVVTLAVQRVIVDKDKLPQHELGQSKNGDFGGVQASVFYTSKGYPHIHATEALFMKRGKSKKKAKDVVMINDIHHSDGTSTFWWKDSGNGTFKPSGNNVGGTPTQGQKTLAEAFVNGWGSIE